MILEHVANTAIKQIKEKEFLSGKYEESGAILAKSFLTFYEVYIDEEDEGEFRVVAWARWDTFHNKGWTKRPPSKFGAGVPSRENEDDFLAWELCSDTTPQEYDIPFTVYEDGSATLQLNENVTLSFEKSSFDFDDFQ